MSLLLKTNVSSAACPDLLNYQFKKLHSSETLNLCNAAEAKAVLFINTASNCGFTGQFKDLEVLSQRYMDQGLVLIGFPSNDFRQEEKEEEDVAKVCYVYYGVSFDMPAPISVKGKDAHPLFQSLAKATKKPRWNFNKYLYDPKIGTVTHYGAMTKPLSKKLINDIEALL